MAIDTTNKALTALGVKNDTLSLKQKDTLDRDGYLVLPPMPEHWLRAGGDIQTIRDKFDELVEIESWLGGSEGMKMISKDCPIEPGVNRLANLANKHPLFRHAAIIPEVLAAIHHVIADEIKTGDVHGRAPTKGEGAQALHIDWLPRLSESDAFDNAAAAIFLDDTSLDNGPFRAVPGTHRCLDWPDEHLDDRNARHPREVRMEVPAGSILVFIPHIWHGGTTNQSGAIRRTIYIDYRNRRLPQNLNQKTFMSPETINNLSEAERYLFAVRESDPDTEMDALTPGAAYRERYGRGM